MMNWKAVREIWDAFVFNCMLLYAKGEYMTINEMLEPFQGRCLFKMYMPKKASEIWLKNYVLI